MGEGDISSPAELASFLAGLVLLFGAVLAVNAATRWEKSKAPRASAPPETSLVDGLCRVLQNLETETTETVGSSEKGNKYGKATRRRGRAGLRARVSYECLDAILLFVALAFCMCAIMLAVGFRVSTSVPDSGSV